MTLLSYGIRPMGNKQPIHRVEAEAPRGILQSLAGKIDGHRLYVFVGSIEMISAWEPNVQMFLFNLLALLPS